MRLQLRRGTAAQWTADNPVLAAGEPGYATDTKVLKIGDGTTPWSSLAQYGGVDPRLSGYGLESATLADYALATTAYTMTAGLFVAVLAPLVAGQTVTQLGCVLDTAGVTSSGVNEMCIYSVAGAVATKVATTVDMSATLAGAPAALKEALLQATYTPTSTALHYITLLTHFSGTAPKITGSATAISTAAFAPIHGLYPSVFISAQATSPATFNPTTATINSAAYYFTVT